MNILVIGNGFDLAHGLPTKYTDFLNFVELIKQFIDADGRKFSNSDWNNAHSEIVELIKKNALPKAQEWRELLEENFWIDYFLQCPMYQKENWIDFESEICNVIKSLDEDMFAEDGRKYQFSEEIMVNLSNDFLDAYFEEHSFVGQYDENGNHCGALSYKAIRDTLYRDLNKLIRALEIYFTEYVGNLECNVISPDIKAIVDEFLVEGTGRSPVLTNALCFNYTDTYKRIYFNQFVIDRYIDYIHGKADINNTIETNNMVLGIDEYLLDERKNKDVEFIAFKKFYQRIYKGTGCKYREWVERIEKEYIEYLQKQEEAYFREHKFETDNVRRMMNQLAASAIRDEKCTIHNVYIFGHSLDVTDGDILRNLILHENVHTTIFYHNKDVMGQQIANLVKVIGQDELIKRTGGSTKTIEFKLQAGMVERKE